MDISSVGGVNLGKYPATGSQRNSNFDSANTAAEAAAFAEVLKDLRKVFKQARYTSAESRRNKQCQPYDGDDADSVQDKVCAGEFIFPHGPPFVFLSWSGRQWS